MASARSAFAASSDARQIRTFVSKKLPGIRFFPVKLEIMWQPTSVGAQLIQKILSAGLPRHAKLARGGDLNFNFVAFLEPQGLHHSSGKPDGETVAPFRDLQGSLLGYTCQQMYIHSLWPVKDRLCWQAKSLWSRGRLSGYASACEPASYSRSSFFDILPTGVLGSSSRISMAPIISCLPSRSFRNAFISSNEGSGAPAFNLTKAFGVSPRYSSGIPMTLTSSIAGC